MNEITLSEFANVTYSVDATVLEYAEDSHIEVNITNTGQVPLVARYGDVLELAIQSETTDVMVDYVEDPDTLRDMAEWLQQQADNYERFLTELDKLDDSDDLEPGDVPKPADYWQNE